MITYGHGLRTPNEAFFHRNTNFLGLQTIWADKFLGFFGRFVNTHFGTVGPLSIFFYQSTIFSTKNQAFISEYQIFIWDWDRKELEIQPSCVRSPCLQQYIALVCIIFWNQLVFINRVNYHMYCISCNDMGHFQIAVLVTRPPLIHQRLLETM